MTTCLRHLCVWLSDTWICKAILKATSTVFQGTQTNPWSFTSFFLLPLFRGSPHSAGTTIGFNFATKMSQLLHGCLSKTLFTLQESVTEIDYWKFSWSAVKKPRSIADARRWVWKILSESYSKRKSEAPVKGLDLESGF